MPNITCKTCGKGAYELADTIFCINCNEMEKNCNCKKNKSDSAESIKIIKRHLKGIEKAIKELEKE